MTIPDNVWVHIEMTETVHYSLNVDVREAGRLLGCDPTVEAIREKIESEPSSDYGVEDATDLLDTIIDSGFDSVEDRWWSFEVDEDAEPWQPPTDPGSDPARRTP